MLTLALVFAAAVVLGVDGQTTNYSAMCAAHTMVAYPPVGPLCFPVPAANGTANTTAYTGVNATEIAFILTTHNNLRRKVAVGNETRGAPGPQPNASNMRELKWDAELALVAQRWASQCSLTPHDTCRNVSRFPWVGQNVYKYKFSANVPWAPWNASIYAWYDEVAGFNKSNINPFVYVSTPVTGHYSQVVWANTSLVGCGYHNYKSNATADASYPYVRVTVCNYGAGGNVMGAGTPMYLTGTPCSQCPTGTTCSNSLCV